MKFTFSDLYRRHKLVANRLRSIIAERDVSKVAIANGTGISRPTLNKLLDGKIENERNYASFMEKICAFLELSPDDLMAHIKNPYVQVENLCSLMKVDEEKLCDKCGITIDRLQEIKSGGEASVAEIRDLAMSLEVSTFDFLGLSPFKPQTTLAPEHFWAFDEPSKPSCDEYCHWGFVGIKVNGETAWHPITRATAECIDSWLEEGLVTIPCLDNTLLFVNTHNVEAIYLSTELTDPIAPPCKIYPPVFYETVEEYMDSYNGNLKDTVPTQFSKSLISLMDNAFSENMDECRALYEQSDMVCVCGANGRYDEYYAVNPESLDGIIINAFNVYLHGNTGLDERVLSFRTLSDLFVYYRIDNIAYMELPLSMVLQHEIESREEE